MPPDPILAAIIQHRQAWESFQVAPEGDASEVACLGMHDARSALLAMSCTTIPGAQALVDHLRWWIAEESSFADDYQPDYVHAAARATELKMLLELQASGIDVLDPIFAVLDVADAAEIAHALACEGLDEADYGSMRDCNSACDRAVLARREVMQTEPTTIGGLRALACYLARWGETSAEDGFLQIARSLSHTDPKIVLKSPWSFP